MKRKEIINRLYSLASIKKIKDKMLQASLNGSSVNYLFNRLAIALMIFIGCIFIPHYGFIIAVVLSLLFYYISEYIYLDQKIKQKAYQLESGALSFFEVLLLALNNNKKMYEALNLTINNTSGILKDEFAKTIEESNVGKSLNDALNDMTKRIPSDMINNLILSLKLILISEKNIALLNEQIDRLYEKHYQNIKNRTSYLPVKIILLSVVFVIPLSLVLIYIEELLAFFS